MRWIPRIIVALWAIASGAASCEPLGQDAVAELVTPPFSLGAAVNDRYVWQLLNSGGAVAGYVFETEILAPLPGFSGAPINMLVTMDLEGTFLNVRLLQQNEPIFVSGLGEAPFRKFFEQYRGLAISQPIVVGTPYGHADSGDLVYLDGVTKATASVRIAHESILAAARAVAQEKMRGIQTLPPARPDPDHDEALTWEAMLAEGLVGRLRVTNAEVDDLFAGTRWADDDPEARGAPEADYADLYVVDVGPPSLARAVLAPDTLAELAALRLVAPSDEPLLLIEAGRHGIVSEDFVRNTAPDLVRINQDGLPVALRDADLFVELAADLPERLRDARAMILRTDRRLGFDPAREWSLQMLAQREHGMFKPETMSVPLELSHATNPRFFLQDTPPRQAAPWVEALRHRSVDIATLAVGLAGLALVMLRWMSRLAGHSHFDRIRLAVLAAMVLFVGWYGQGQLSIVTPLAVLRTALDGGSFAFLLFDPFSLLLWGAVLLSFVLWGRGLFCGWLCPFGALQELADALARRLKLRQVDVPPKWDRRLKWVKYGLLAGLVATVFLAPGQVDRFAEVEPFKTAITVQFRREWIYVAYAGGWLLLGMVIFKGFCRYACPLGALMAIGGLLRGRDWIKRREACGSPCQLCKVRCRYGAIRASGSIDYSECFQCLDCVAIHDDPAQCVPLVLAERRRNGRRAA